MHILAKQYSVKLNHEEYLPAVQIIMSALFALISMALIAGSSCGRLEPQYLPPRPGAGGGGSATPFGGSSYSGGGAQIPILRYENVNNGDGTYRYSYETGNGISAHESGAPRAPGPEGPAVTAEGGFSFRTPDGQQVSLTYTADENGFHPVGSHIPTPPPIPEEILRSIEFNRRNPSSEGAYNPSTNSDGGYRY